MGSVISTNSRSLRGRYQTWSLMYVPKHIINEIAKAASSYADGNESFIQDMNELLEYSWNAAANLRGEDNYNKILHMLKQMQRKEVCRGSWCAAYRSHLVRKDNPRCYTIGGLHHFLMCHNVLNAAELFETHQQEIEKYFRSKQYPNVFAHMGSFMVNSLRKCRRRNAAKDLQVFVDWNTLTEEETRLVVVLLKQTEFVTPFVIPRRPSRDDRVEEWINWKNFVQRQITSANSGSVIIMKNRRKLINATIAVAGRSNYNLDEFHVRNSFEALQFVWSCAYRQQMFVIGVRKEAEPIYPHDIRIPIDDDDPNDEDSDPESDQEEFEEENEEDYEENMTSVFPLGCFQLPGEESSFAESLLMCAYVAKRHI